MRAAVRAARRSCRSRCLAPGRDSRRIRGRFGWWLLKARGDELRALKVLSRDANVSDDNRAEAADLLASYERVLAKYEATLRL